MKLTLPYWLRAALGQTPNQAVRSLADVREGVLSALSAVTDVPRAAINRSSTLVGDLGIDGDDYAMSLVPELQWHFRFVASRSDWEQVRTVGDLEDLVSRHCEARPIDAER